MDPAQRNDPGNVRIELESLERWLRQSEPRLTNLLNWMEQSRVHPDSAVGDSAISSPTSVLVASEPMRHVRQEALGVLLMAGSEPFELNVVAFAQAGKIYFSRICRTICGLANIDRPSGVRHR